MPRPGFVLDVDNNTPTLPMWRNDRLTATRLPEGSSVLYPPEALTPIVDLRANVRHALKNPVQGEPLTAHLKPDIVVTVAFDDLTATDRALTTPDPRSIAIETVLSAIAAAGIDDVILLNARGLGRRMNKTELSAMLGDRITDSFTVADLLLQHDADNDEMLQNIGTGDVQINKRIANSDLLIYITIDPTDASAYRNIAARITDAGTARTISDLPQKSLDEFGIALEKTLPVFQIALALNNAQFADCLSFLQSRAFEWSTAERASFHLLQRGLDLTPGPIRSRLMQIPPSRQAVIGVVAGTVKATHQACRSMLCKQYEIEQQTPADVVIVGTPPASPYAINSVLNPLMAAHHALTTAVPHDAPAFVRNGGAVILHGFESSFDPQMQPSFIDFFEDVLPSTHDDLAKSEQTYAGDAWYSHLYRTSYAHHGTLPFHLWAECAPAREQLGGVIVIGGDTDAAHRLGFRRASTFGDALEMASDITNTPQPAVTHLPFPAPRHLGE